MTDKTPHIVYSCKKIKAGKYEYRGWVISRVGYYEPERRVCWEGVNPITNCGDFHGYSKKQIKELIDISLSSNINKLSFSNEIRKPPRYIKVKGVEMRYDNDVDEYYRHAGCWYLKYKYIDNKLVADCDYMPWLHEMELKEITVNEWREGNRGYL
jgi:hypothetical protein